jgi:hypothetical protein
VSAELNIPDEAVAIIAGQLLPHPEIDVEREKALMALMDAAPLIVAANQGSPLAPMPDVDQHVADARTALDEALAAANLPRTAWLSGVAQAHDRLAGAYDLVVERLRLTPESAVFEMAVSARAHHYSEAGELRHKAKLGATEPGSGAAG